jgi:hypothetical protein
MNACMFRPSRSLCALQDHQVLCVRVRFPTSTPAPSLDDLKLMSPDSGLMSTTNNCRTPCRLSTALDPHHRFRPTNMMILRARQERQANHYSLLSPVPWGPPSKKHNALHLHNTDPSPFPLTINPLSSSVCLFPPSRSRPSPSPPPTYPSNGTTAQHSISYSHPSPANLTVGNMQLAGLCPFPSPSFSSSIQAQKTFAGFCSTKSNPTT